MKKILLVLGLVLMGVGVFGQGNWVWARQGVGGTSQETYGVATDAFGNVYATGVYYDSSATFGSFTLTNAGQGDMFLVKYSSTGLVLWARSAGGTNNDQGNSVAVDAAGNIYVTGFYRSHNAVFGTDTLIDTGTWENFFVVKYSSLGAVMWTKSAGTGIDSDIGNSVATDALGNVYVAGNFTSSTLVLDTVTIINNTVGSGSEMFVAKFDSSGTTLWGRNGGGIGYSYGNSVATNISGNIYVTGYWAGPNIVFGTITLTNSTFSSGVDMFIVKYNSAGTVLYAKNAHGLGNNFGTSVAADALGNAYATGYFASTSIVFGNDTLINVDNTGSTNDMFLVKYDSIGTILFAKSAGGSSNEKSNSVATDNSGNAYISGNFKSPSIVFGSTTLTNVDNTGSTSDMFLVKYSSTGTVIWANGEGGSSNDFANSVNTDASGNVYFAGMFASSNVTFSPTTLTNVGSGDMFVAKLDSTQLTVGNKEITNNENVIILYPNPATSNLTIAFAKNTKRAVLTITDITGKLLYTATASETGKMNVTTSNFAEGIYFVKMQTEEGVETRKLIVEK